MKRDYTRFDTYVNRLSQDVYAQPPDPGHTRWATDVVRTLCTIPRGAQTVLDVGCGQGFLKPVFESIDLTWEGVTIGEDYLVCKEAKLPVHNEDMTFLPFANSSFDIVFARHALEHSPFPVITLMEWRRVCKMYLVLVAPAPEYWGVRGRNHYSVFPKEHLNWLLARAGWHTINYSQLTTHDTAYLEVQDPKKREKIQANPEAIVEYRYLCEKSDGEYE